MPTIATTGWFVNVAHEDRTIITSSFIIKVHVRWFTVPNDRYCVVFPAERVVSTDWVKWLTICRANAYWDIHNKYWVFTKLSLERLCRNSYYKNNEQPTEEERKKIRQARKEAEEKFNISLAEVSKLENVPEELWPTFNYPPHYLPKNPSPTTLQRIVVSRYWQSPYALIAASVGTGKSRMTVDVLSARSLSKNTSLRVSSKIILVVAPLTLHENWKREFKKWTDVDFRCHKFSPTERFWEQVEKDAEEVCEDEGLSGGVVIITTPQSLSRDTIVKQFADHTCVPTFIVVDEIQRFFRNLKNKAFQNLYKLRLQAHGFMGLTGTPTSDFEDWFALEELMSAGAPQSHWKDGSFEDYSKASQQETLTYSGLWESGWSFDRLVKEFHYDRIKKGNVFMADKWFYMKDSLPGLEQTELGDFADTRLSFAELFDKYPDFVQEAYDMQKRENPDSFKDMNDTALAMTLLLRMQQITALSETNTQLLESFVEDFLEKDEPAVIWTMFRDELMSVSNLLAQISGTSIILGEQKPVDRQKSIDDFMGGHKRFLVSQVQAGGVGITLTRAKRSLFLSTPFSYLDVSQAIGRLHRIGQKEDVTSYFAMTSPIAAFSRSIYDRRSHLNEIIPQKISGVLTKLKR